MNARHWAILLLLLAAGAAVANARRQSLAEAARKEAERRQQLGKQGIQGKRIDGVDPGSVPRAGAVTISSPGPHSAAPAAPAAKEPPRATLRSFQSRLQKLDRDIALAEERLKVLKAKADAERWAPVRTIKGSKGSASSSQDQLRWQILELEGRLELMRRDRSDTFQAGRKAGYLPGELENRGTIR